MPSLFDRQAGFGTTWGAVRPDTQMFVPRMPAGFDTAFFVPRSPYPNAFPQPDSNGVFPDTSMFVPRPVVHDSQLLMAAYPSQWPGIHGRTVDGIDNRNAQLYRRDHDWSYPRDLTPGGTFAFPDWYGTTGGDARAATLIGPPRPLGDYQDARNYVKPMVGNWGDATHYTAPPPTKSTSAKPVASPSETKSTKQFVGSPRSDTYYTMLSDQQLADLYNASSGGGILASWAVPDKRLAAEYSKRWESKVVPHGAFGEFYKNLDDNFGTMGRFIWNDIANAGNMIANHPLRHTWNGSPEPPPGVYLDDNGNPVIGTAPQKPGTAPVKKPGATGASGRAAAAAAGAGGAAGVGGAGGAGMPGSISALFDRVNSNLDAIQKRNDAEAAGYKTEADAAFKGMQDITNAPPPSIDPKNQMYTMLAANIAKALNPNIDAPGQAQQLIGTKLEGMREQNRQNYQMMAEKYRRASELFDKRGDHARAIELAKASDNLIKQAEMSMNESHFQAQMRMARDEKEQARLQRSFELDTSTLKSYAERLQELVQKTSDNNMKKRYQTRLTKTLRMLDKVTGTQLNSMGDPSKLTPVNPDSLYDELFATLDADHFPKNRAEMLKLFHKNKNFKDDALQNVWGFTQNEVMDYWLRKYGNNGGGM